MKGISNRQKMIVRARENTQKCLLRPKKNKQLRGENPARQRTTRAAPSRG